MAKQKQAKLQFGIRCPEVLAATILRYKAVLRKETLTDTFLYFIEMGVAEFERRQVEAAENRKEETDRNSETGDMIETSNELAEIKELLHVILAQNACLYEAGPYTEMVKKDRDYDAANEHRDALYKMKLRDVKEKSKYL